MSNVLKGHASSDRDRPLSDLPLIAALAAVSFDTALANREPDMAPVHQLARLLNTTGKLGEETKKAVARIAELGQSKTQTATEAAQLADDDALASTSKASEKLDIAATKGLTSLTQDDLRMLKKFCMRLSIATRRPRIASPMRLR
jgi:hypothetical protein